MSQAARCRIPETIDAKRKVCREYEALPNVAAGKFFLANGKTPNVVNQLQADE